jgi:hypothetical protein
MGMCAKPVGNDGKACGWLVENSPQQLGKVPVSAVYNGAGKCPAGCGWKVDISRTDPGPKSKGTGRLARPVPYARTSGYFSEVLMSLKFVLSWAELNFSE